MASHLGEFYAFLSIIAFAFGGVAVARARRSGPGDGGALLSVVLTAALSSLVWLAAGTSKLSIGRLEGDGWIGLAWFALSGLLSTAAGRSLYFLSVHALGAIRASAVKRAIPFFSVVFGIVFLKEVLTGPKLAGVGLIAVSIGALVALDLRAINRPGVAAREDVNPAGYLWGTASGLAYAASYVARKLGLQLVPDGAFGTFVGAMAALAYYAAAGAVSGRNRTASLAALTARNGWAVVAATGFSLGQIANFYAIQYAAVSTVGAIQSLEVFVSMLVATLVLRTERAPSLTVIAAAAVATLGVLFVVVG